MGGRQGTKRPLRSGRRLQGGGQKGKATVLTWCNGARLGCCQAALPGLKGFAATNAAVRYELLVDHVEATLLYQPGNSLEAMQVRPRRAWR